MQNFKIDTAAMMAQLAAEKRDPRAVEAAAVAVREAAIARIPVAEKAPLLETPQDFYSVAIYMLRDEDFGTPGNHWYQRTEEPVHEEGFPARVICWSGEYATAECAKMNDFIVDSGINADRDMEIHGRYRAVIHDGPVGRSQYMVP